ncbi:hypothetical protein FGO68_gene11235 [Halteria grandinella]|uniref:Uncharacterized protein n=1 Tax=Halteria grandinella TaxID=5974 RepID=A0A8J8NEE0_HALGN|nr:hypothetical protein FGO68_gene11235 [Halteria grandinella]
MFPITKVSVRMRPQPQKDSDVIRLRFLERPWRYYLGISQHWQAFFKTVVLSAILIIIPYNFVYYLAWTRSKAEILSKQDPFFTSDGMKQYVREFKKRKQEGMLENMQEIIGASENGDGSGTGSDWAKSMKPSQTQENVDEE